MIRIWSICCLVLVVIAGCSNDDPETIDDSDDEQESKVVDLTVVHEMPPGNTYMQTLETSEREGIRFGIHVPNTYDSEAPTPLVLSLHPGGNNGPDFGAKTIQTFILPGLGELRPIVVGPDSGGKSWKNDVVEARVMKLMQEVIKTYNVDESKIVVAGYSMGAQGAWYMAGQYPEMFSAVIAVSGRPDEESVESGWNIPTYVIHSRNDEVMPFDRTRQIVERLQAQGAPITMDVQEGLTHFQSRPFIEPLRKAVPWLKQIWEGEPSE